MDKIILTDEMAKAFTKHLYPKKYVMEWNFGTNFKGESVREITFTEDGQVRINGYDYDRIEEIGDEITLEDWMEHTKEYIFIQSRREEKI